MLFVCYICGSEVQSAQKYEDLVGNKIYICYKCGKKREHRVEYKYRRINDKVRGG